VRQDTALGEAELGNERITAKKNRTEEQPYAVIVSEWPELGRFMMRLGDSIVLKLGPPGQESGRSRRRRSTGPRLAVRDEADPWRAVAVGQQD
jgi:hypothetical protein